MRRFLRLVFLSIIFIVCHHPLFAQPLGQDRFHETLRLGRGAVQHIEWQPNGSLILVDTIRGAWFYTPDSNRLVDVTHIEDARLACFSPNGHRLAGVNDQNEITLWDPNTFTQTRSLPGHDVYVRAIEWNPDGKRLASLDRTGQIIVWDTVNAEKSLELSLSSADQIAWSRTGRYLAAADSESGTVRVWDWDTAGNLVFASTPEYPPQYNSDIIWQHDTHLLRRNFGEVPSGDLLGIASGTITSVPRVGYASDYSPDGSKLAVSAIGAAVILDMDSGGDTLYRVDGPQAVVVAWSPDGQYIAFGDWTSSIHVKAHVRVVDAATGSVVSAVPYDFSIKSLAWNSESTEVVVVDNADQISTLGPGSSYTHARNTAHTDIGDAAVWRSDGQMIAAADTRYGASLWDAETGDLLISRMGHRQPATQLAWQPGGTLLATAGGDGWQSEDNNVYIWDSSVEPEAIFDQNVIIPHVDLVAGIAWSPDGTTLASIERERYIRLWKPDEPGTIRVIDTWAVRLAPFIDYTQRISSLEWSTGGDMLDYSYSSSGNDGGVHLIDVAAGTMVEADTPTNHASTWAWTLDNQFIWVNWGNSDRVPSPAFDMVLGQYRLAEDAQSYPVFSGLEGQVTHAAFSPDAQLLIGFDDLNHGLIWDVQTQTPSTRLANVQDVVWSPDSTMIAVYGTDGLIRIVNVQTGDTLHTFHQHFREEPSYRAGNPQVIWSPDSQRIALLDRGVLFIYGPSNVNAHSPEIR